MAPSHRSRTMTCMPRLAGSKKHHADQRDAQMGVLKQRLAAAEAALARGSCVSAYTNILDLWEARGASEAHGREVGSTAWFPQTQVVDLAYAFTTKCLRNEPVSLEGARRRRRRR